MTPTRSDLTRGRPRFLDATLNEVRLAQGDAAAWVAAFTQHGSAAPAHVHGDFAVGVTLPDGRVFLALDRFSACTLCYRVADGRLQFSERADALAGPDAEIDPQALFDYLYFHVIPSPRTVFKGVLRLPPGHCALFDHGRLTVAPYWTPSFQPPSSEPSFDALKSEFRELLQGAVRSTLDGGKPGCFLSGGTDSSTVAGMVGLAAGQAAATYSIGFEAEGYDEMAFARIAARHFGTAHHEYYVTPDDLVRSIGHVAQHYDQPFGNSSAVPAYYCAKMAREDGVTRILAGDGGDELFGGNTRYAKQRVFGVYDDMPSALRGALDVAYSVPGMASVPLLRKGASYIEQARVPMPDRLQSYNLLQRLGVHEVLTAGFLHQVETDDPRQQQRRVWAQAADAGLLDKQLAFDWRYTLAENDLAKVRGTTQLADIEVGFPMLDARLVDFSMRLPTHYKLKGLKLRWFFKEALRGFLPDDIIKKKKQGFGLPFGVWAVRHQGLNALARDTLGSLSTRGIVRPDFITLLLDHKLAEHPGYYGEMVWILMILEQWLQKHAAEYRIAQ